MAFLRNILWFYAPATEEYKIPLDVARTKIGSRHRADLYEKFFAALTFGENNPSESVKFRLFATVWEQLTSSENKADDFLNDFARRFAAIDFSDIQKSNPEIVQMLQQLGPLYRYAFSLDLWESMQGKQRAANEYVKSCSHHMQKLQRETTQAMNDLGGEIDQFLAELVRKEMLFNEKCDFLKTPAGRVTFEAKKSDWRRRCEDNDNVFERELTRLTLAISDLEHELDEAADFAAIQAKKDQLHEELLVWKAKSAPAMSETIIDSMLEPMQEVRLNYQHLDEAYRQLLYRFSKVKLKTEADVADIRQDVQSLHDKQHAFFLTQREIKLAHTLLADDKQLSTVEKTIIDVVRKQYYQYQGLSAYVIATPAVDIWNPGVAGFVSGLCSQRAMINSEAIFFKSQGEDKLVLEKQIAEVVLLAKKTLVEHEKKIVDTRLHSRHPGFSELSDRPLLEKIDQRIQRAVHDSSNSYTQIEEQLRNELNTLVAERQANRARLIAKCEVQIARLKTLEDRKSRKMLQNQQLLNELSARPSSGQAFELPSPTPKVALSALAGVVSGFSVTSGVMLALQVGLTGVMISNPVGWGIGLLAVGAVAMIGAISFGVQAYNRHVKNKLITKWQWISSHREQLFVQNDALKNAASENKIQCPRSTRHVMMACGIILNPQANVSLEEIPCKLTGDLLPRQPLYFNRSTGAVYFKKSGSVASRPITPESPEFYKILDRKPRQA